MKQAGELQTKLAYGSTPLNTLKLFCRGTNIQNNNSYLLITTSNKVVDNQAKLVGTENAQATD